MVTGVERGNAAVKRPISHPGGGFTLLGQVRWRKSLARSYPRSGTKMSDELQLTETQGRGGAGRIVGIVILKHVDEVTLLRIFSTL